MGAFGWGFGAILLKFSLNLPHAYKFILIVKMSNAFIVLGSS